MMVCSEIRSREREKVVDQVRILVEELLEEGDGGTGLWCGCRSSVWGEGSSAGRMVGGAASDGSTLGGWEQ